MRVFTEYDPFSDEPYKPTIFDRVRDWFTWTRFYLWLGDKFGKCCGMCGDPIGFSKGNVCHTCWRDLKFYGEGE